MKFGMFFIGSAVTDNHARTIEEALGQIEYAEELGYDSVWFAEHHSSYGMLGSPAVIMAAAAQRTTRIRLGVAVAVLPFHNPVSIAEDYAMVDVLSGGRLDFAVGRGNQSLEYHMMQADRDNSKSVFWEALELIQSLWSASGPISYHGKHFDFENIETFPKPLQKPVPLWVAAVTPSTFDEAAARGLRIMTAGGAASGSFEKLAESQKQARAALAAAGAPPEWMELPMAMNTYIAATPERARDEFKYANWMQHELTPNNPFAAATTPTFSPDSPDFAVYARASKELKAVSETADGYIEHALSKGSILCTDPAGARDYLRRAQTEAQVDYFICPTNLGGLADALIRESMRLFAEEVMPEFRSEPSEAIAQAAE